MQARGALAPAAQPVSSQHINGKLEPLTVAAIPAPGQTTTCCHFHALISTVESLILSHHEPHKTDRPPAVTMAAVSDESAARRQPMAPAPLKPVIPEGKVPAITQRKGGPLSWVTKGQPTNYNMVRAQGD